MKQSSHIVVPEGLKTVLLHACCAPCSSAIVEWLLAHEIEPVIYYFNPNIWPREEYEIRKQESKRHAESLGVRWIEGDGLVDERVSGLVDERVSGHEAWRQAVCGLEDEPERGKRCEMCFYHRLLATANKAQELGIGWFATTLASSRWKNIEQVNTAGMKAAEQVAGVQFWAQNWRKDGLQDRRNTLLKEYNFYNQKYCGCEFSIRQQNTIS